MSINPLESPEVQPKAKSQANNVRGCGFGCLYTIGCFVGANIVAGILVALFLPIILDAQKVDMQKAGASAGALAAPIVLLISIGFGIYGFVHHRKRKK